MDGPDRSLDTPFPSFGTAFRSFGSGDPELRQAVPELGYGRSEASIRCAEAWGGRFRDLDTAFPGFGTACRSCEIPDPSFGTSDRSFGTTFRRRVSTIVTVYATSGYTAAGATEVAARLTVAESDGGPALAPHAPIRWRRRTVRRRRGHGGRRVLERRSEARDVAQRLPQARIGCGIALVAAHHDVADHAFEMDQLVAVVAERRSGI